MDLTTTQKGGLYRVGTGDDAKFVDASGNEVKAPNDAAPASSTASGGELAGVDFASDEAAQAAATAGLTAASFKDQTPSGANGFTKADVTRIASATSA